MSRSNRSPDIGLSAKARRTGEPPISVLMAAALADPNLINFAAGFVDPLTLPVEPVRKITETIFSNPERGRAALQYDTTRGLASLREAAIHHLEKLERKTAHELHISPRDILITTGSQQALYLIGDCLIDPGDIVIAANPCYFVFTGTLASLGANVLAVPMTEDGIDVAAVEQLLARLEREGRLDRVKMIYTTSYYQNPTGLTLSLESRKKLLEIARRFSKRTRILILEDAAYRELRYDGPDLPSIKSLEGANVQTILTQTFSKPFAPGLKTGYTILPPELLEAVVHQKGNHDFGSASLTQHIAAEAMNGGLYYEHVKRLCESYRHKRDAILDSLQRYSPKNDGISWTHPAGGLYVWVTLPPHCDASRDSALFAESTRRGVLYVPGDYSFQPDETGRVPKNHLRLSFGQVDPQQIEPGIKRFCEALTTVLSPRPSAGKPGEQQKREAIFRA
jgi:2-aminoadipate transaminase